MIACCFRLPDGCERVAANTLDLPVGRFRSRRSRAPLHSLIGTSFSIRTSSILVVVECCDFSSSVVGNWSGRVDLSFISCTMDRFCAEAVFRSNICRICWKCPFGRHRTLSRTRVSERTKWFSCLCGMDEWDSLWSRNKCEDKLISRRTTQ